MGLAPLVTTASAQTVVCSPKEFPPSLVRIERQPPRAPGSGVVLVKRDRFAIVLTAKHVVEGEQDFSVYFQVAPDRRVPVKWTDETMFGFPPDGDLVVFRVDAPIPAAVIPEDPFTRDMRDGGRLVSWGYPAARKTGTLCSHESTLVTTAGGQLIADGYVETGVSGGPMFFIDPEDKAPKLAGIVVRGDGDLKKGTTHAIDIRQAVTIVATSRDPGNGNKPHMWPNILLPDVIDVDARLRTFVKVDRGEFLMGSNSGDERWPAGTGAPAGARSVTLPAFYMAKFEVTVAQYKECIDAGRCTHGGRSVSSNEPDHPVAGVSWYEARTYAEWLQSRLVSTPATPRVLRRLLDSGWQVDLPSEEEWEKAARHAGKDTYPWGPSPNLSFANYNSGQLKRVGASKCASCAYGLADMAGNVREWTRSLKLDYPYIAAKAEDLAATGRRAIRGGSYERLFVGAERVRAANREDAEPNSFDRYTGFRVALICRKDRGCTWQEPD
jgi:formylglycine-generating enzyme required for sulfatase activity